MRFKHKKKHSSRQIALVAPIALFMVLCGAILFAVSQRLEPFGRADSTEVDSATRSAVERALQHLDEADRSLDEGNGESGKFHIQWAREALHELLLAPPTTNRGGET